jgi:hypothetical protein
MPEPPRFRQGDLRPSRPRYDDRLVRELEGIEEALDLLREEAAKRADLVLLSAVDLCERLLRLLGVPPAAPPKTPTKHADSATEGQRDAAPRKPAERAARPPEKPGPPF